MTVQGKKMIKAFSSPYFISFILSVPLCIFLSDLFPRYQSKLTFSGPVEKPDGVIYYQDLDNDGFSEEIISFTDTKGSAAFKVTDRYGKITNSGEFEGSLPFRGSRLIFGDYNQDGNQELYAFFVRKDSLFMSAKEFGNKDDNFIHDRFITFLGNDLGTIDCNITDAGLQDLDSNGMYEIIFSVMAGFPVFPRNIFLYEINTDSLYCSPFTGSIAMVADIYDFDNDGKSELFFFNYAPANLKDSLFTGLVDSSCWMIVLDHRMNFKFKPVEFKGYTTSLASVPFYRENKGYLGVVVRSRATHRRHKEICIYDERGVLIKIITSPDTIRNINIRTMPLDHLKDRFAIIDDSRNLVEYDQNLTVLKKKRYDYFQNRTLMVSLDLDSDGKKENIFYGYTGDVAITRYDLSAPSLLKIAPENKFINTALKMNGNRPPEIMLQSERFYYLISYKSNSYFYWQFPLYAGIFFFFYGITFLVLYFQKKILQDKYDAEKRISELQLMVVKDQMDPHFIFNAMNTISSLAILKKPEEAQQRIVGLSRLMKSVIESSGKISQSLEVEIDFIRNYLEFQQKRYENLFSYQIDIDNEVKMLWQIPRMVIQIPVENSIKHGLVPLGEGGILHIKVCKDQSDILITVEDNGIGRAAARFNKITSTSKGLSILDQNFEILNRYNADKIIYEIQDMKSSDDKPVGTRVIIRIPIKLNYKLYEQ